MLQDRWWHSVFGSVVCRIRANERALQKSVSEPPALPQLSHRDCCHACHAFPHHTGAYQTALRQTVTVVD